MEIIRNIHTCNGSAKEEKDAENSLLRTVTKFDEKTFHIQKLSEPQKDKYKESHAWMQHSQSVERQRENLESSKRNITPYIQGSISVINGCLLIRNTRPEGNGMTYPKYWKKNNCLWIILWLAKLSFKNEAEINTLLCKNTEFVASRPASQEIPKEILKVVKKWQQMAIQIHRKKLRHWNCK